MRKFIFYLLTFILTSHLRTLYLLLLPLISFTPCLTTDSALQGRYGSPLLRDTPSYLRVSTLILLIFIVNGILIYHHELLYRPIHSSIYFYFTFHQPSCGASPPYST